MKHHLLSRRQFLRASGAVVSMGALTACAVPTPSGGVQGEGAATTQEVIALQFATQYPEPPMNAGDDQIIAKFNEENPDITIEKMTWPGQDFHDKLRLLATAGDLPDIFNMESKQLVDMVSRNMILEITDLFNGQQVIKQEDYFEGDWQKQQFNGKQYSLSLDSQDVILYYNKDLFDAKGIAYPPKSWDDPAWTYDKLLEIALQLSEGEGASRVFGYQTSRWWVYAYPIVWSYGGMITNEDRTESRITMEETLAALQFRTDLVNKHHVEPSPAEQTEGVDTLFGSGRLAMRAIWNPWMWYIKDVPDLHFDIAAMPSGPKGAFTRTPQDCFAIGSQTKASDAAFQFALYAAGPVGQEIMCNQLGLGTPTLKAVAALDSFVHPPAKGLEHIDQSLVLDMLNSGHYKHQDVTTKWPEMDKMITAEMDALLDGGQSVEEFANKLDPQITALLQSIPVEQRGWIGD